MKLLITKSNEGVQMIESFSVKECFELAWKKNEKKKSCNQVEQI